MDNLGIKFNSGKIDYSYYLSLKKTSNIQTNVLSDSFKLFPRSLNYQWLHLNTEQIEQSIDEFIKLLKRTERLGNKREEKLYHKFFLNNRHFILRDNYSKFWYEARLEKQNRKYEEPDFALKPNFNYHTDLSIVEVKLPNEGFIKIKKYHRSPLSSLINHLIQVSDYKDYLESENYKDAINKIFGYVPSRVEFNLLIGREKEKLDKIKDLNKVMRQLGHDYLQLLTYDNLKDYQVKFLERIGLLEIK